MSTAANAAVESYYAALRAGDVETWVATFDHRAVVANPAGAAPISGATALRELWEELTCPFRQLDIVADLVVVTGRDTAVKWTGRAVGWSGEAVTAEGIDIFGTDDAGRITTLTSYWEPGKLRSQLCRAATPATGG